ncbi:caskin-1-like isoform X2 [Phycodurus eques]|uniref:caskin-1-like isoform X2 n=1 Tax=Phycodurus eques TaxID=693459 RepID=UPI002ACEA617|nr:caskin-1-like isoform X2 [Phycodurus eques]
MWRRGGTSDALERAQALLLSAKSNKNNNKRRVDDEHADVKNRAATPNSSEVAADSSEPLDSASHRGGSTTPPARSPEGNRHPAAAAGGGGSRFLKKPPFPLGSKSAETSLVDGSRGTTRFLGKKTTGSPEDPGGESGPKPAEASLLEWRESVDSDEEEVMKLLGDHNSTRSSSRSRTSLPRGRLHTRLDRNPATSEPTAFFQTFGRRSQRSGSPPPRRPSGDSRPSSRCGRGSPLPEKGGPPSSPPRSSASAPEELLTLEGLFPLPSDASEASQVSSHLDFQLNVKSLDDVGSAPSGDSSGGAAPQAAPGEREVSVQGVDYESDFESGGGTDADRGGGGGQVSEHLPGDDEEGVASSMLSSEARTDGEDASAPTTSSRGLTARAGSLSRAPSQPAARLKDAAAQTDADVRWARAGVPGAPADALALTESAKRRLAVARRTARSGRGKRDDVVRGLGPPAYTYATLRRTLEVVAGTRLLAQSLTRMHPLSRSISRELTVTQSLPRLYSHSIADCLVRSRRSSGNKRGGERAERT